jgi:hypothetical protein
MGGLGGAQHDKEPNAVVPAAPFPRCCFETAQASRPVLVVFERFKGEVVCIVAEEKAKPVRVSHKRLTFDYGCDSIEQLGRHMCCGVGEGACAEVPDVCGVARPIDNPLFSRNPLRIIFSPKRREQDVKRVDGEVDEGVAQASVALSRSPKALLDNKLAADEDLNIKATMRLTWIPKRSQRRQHRVRNDPVVMHYACHAVLVEQFRKVVCDLCFDHGISIPNVHDAEVHFIRRQPLVSQGFDAATWRLTAIFAGAAS